MKEFIMAAFPWICIGLVVAVLAAEMSHQKRNDKKGSSENEQKHGKQGEPLEIQEQNADNGENYMTTGMCLGMCFGVAIGTALDQLALGISLGMLIGMCVGMNMKKK